MASIFDIVGKDKEQEGGVDAPVTPATGAGAIDSLTADSMAAAIRKVESGGNYSAEGASGEYGAYQFMPETWKGLANEYAKANKLDAPPEQDREGQDAVAKYTIDKWIKEGLSDEQIAAKWNSGSAEGWETKIGTNDKGVRYDVPGYVKKVLAARANPAKVMEEDKAKAKAQDDAETLDTVLGKNKDPKLSKLEELASIPGGWLQEVKSGIGDMALTAAVNTERLDYEKMFQDQQAFNSAFTSIPLKKRYELSKRFRAEKMDRPAQIQALAEYYEGEVKTELVKQYRSWHDSLGESRPQETTGMLAHIDTIGRGLFRSSPVMFTNALGQAVAGKAGGMGAGVAAGYMLYKGNKYEEYVSHDVNKEWAHKVSDWAAWSLAGVESMSGLMQVGKVMSRFKKAAPLTDIPAKAVDGFVKGMLKGGSTEGAEEYTQAHIEVMFDVLAGGGPNMTGEEWAEKTLAIIKSPDFQRGAWQQAAYGFAGGVALQAAGSGAAKVVKGVFKNDDGSTKPGEGKIPGDNVQKHEKGREFIAPDNDNDVRGLTPAGKQTVDDMMGVTPEDMITEADVDPDAQMGEKQGRELSEDLTTTPKMKEKQENTQASLVDVLDTMSLSQDLKRQKVQIQNADRHLEDLQGLFDEAIIVEDHEEALSLAEEYKAVAGKQIETVGQFIDTRGKSMGKKKTEMAQGERDTAQLYTQDLGKKAGTMVTSQVQAIRVKENQEFIDFADELHTNPTSLKKSLVQQEEMAGNLKSGGAKLYRKLADTLDARRWMGDEQFYGKKVKLDKLLETKSEIERKINREKDDVKVSGYQKAVDDAGLAMVDDMIRGKADWDSQEYAADLQTEKEAEAKAAEQEKKAAATASKKRVTDRRADKHKAVNKTKKEERRVVKKTSEYDKKRAAVQAAKAPTRGKLDKKVPAKPVVASKSKGYGDKVTSELSEDAAAGKARKEAVKKQVAEVAKAERKPHSLPKKAKIKDLKDPKAEYVVLTPDNPQSTEVSPTENRRARMALVKELDDKGIDYEIVDAFFEGTKEKSFIIKGMTKKEGKELSDRLNQSSYIHAKGENIALVEGDKANVVKKSDAKVRPDSEVYTVIEGKRWSIPFYSEKAFDMDAASLQLNDTDIKKAKGIYRSAGIKFGGEVYEGASHMSIIMSNPILEDFINQADIVELSNKIEQGFVSHEGEFTDRQTATIKMGLAKDHYLTSEDFLRPMYEIKAEQFEQGIDTVLSGEENKAILDIVTASVSGQRDPRGKKSTATERQIRNIQAVLDLKTSEISPKRKIELRRKMNDLKSGKALAQKMSAAGFKNLSLADQMGTLELMDSLKQEMKTGKYSWVFDKTKDDGLTTIFTTTQGQYRGLSTTKKLYPDMASLEAASNRFEGGMRPDPKTGKMLKTGGTMGIYHKDTNTAIINLPIISKRRGDINKAMETVVHEHVHGLHKAAFDNMTQAQKNAFGKEITALWESIPLALREGTRDNPAMHPSIRQGIIQIDGQGGSINELITYAMAHPEFANWLNEIPASTRFKAKSSKIKTMWDALVDMIVKTINPYGRLAELHDILNRHLKHGDKSGVRFSMDDFNFGANVKPDHVKGWADELDSLAANGIPSTVVETAQDAAKLVGFEVADNVASMWVPEHEVELHDGKKKKATKTIPAQVVIISENIQSKDHLVSKWMHEQIGHQGLRNAFPNNALMLRFLDQSFAMFQSQDADTLNEIVELYDIGKMNDKGVRKLTKTDKRYAAEEVIARRSEVLKPAVKTGLVNKFKLFLNKWLPKKFLGFKMKPFKMTDADIMHILEMAKTQVLTGNTEASVLLQKKLDARSPRVKFKPWKTLPNFMFTDEQYKSWIREVETAAPQVRRWYDKHQDQLHETFGKDAALFNILLSVTSPQADVNTNVIFACQTYAYMMGLTEKPGALFANKLKKTIDEKWTSPKKMFAALESTLYKVTEFVRGLNGDPDATVGDLWMYRAFFGDSAVYNKESESYSVPQVVAMRQKIIDLAAQMSAETGETYTPREVQAAIWIHINAKTNDIGFDEVADYQSGFNKPSNRFDGMTPLEWLKSMVPNLADGPLGDKIGVSEVPMAPISPLAKKRLDQVRKELAARGKKVDKFEVVDGTITVKSTNQDERILNIIDAIAKDGRRIQVPAEAAEWHRETFGFKEAKTEDGITTMILSDAAVAVFTNPKGKVTPVQIRDNLGGYSGTYTQSARFSKEARSNLDQIAAMSTDKADADFLRTGNDGMSVTGKIHEWRDQSALNWDRFTTAKEQEFLELFGGKKSKILGARSGMLKGTPKTELLQKAMNLYIDSGTGKNLERVQKYLTKLSGIKNLTNRQKGHVMIIDRMMNMTEQETAWVNENIRSYYDDLFTFAQEHKIIDSHVEDYVQRTWKLPQEYKDASISWNGGTGTSGFVLTPTSGKARSLDSIVDGWDLGMDLKTDAVLPNLQSYGNELGYVFANRRFVNYMRSLLTFDANSLMMEGDGNFKPAPGYAKVNDRGFVKPGKILYARKDFADELNKLGSRPSKQMWDSPIVSFLRRINAMLKGTILSVSLFHHLAGMRSYGFGVAGKGFKINGIKAYKRGLKKIAEQQVMDRPGYERLGPVVDYLVREGLTLGRTQDWDQALLQDSMLEEMLMKKTSKASANLLKAWQKGRRTKRNITTGLFSRLFAGLKAEAAAYEFGHNLKLAEKKHGRALTDGEIKLAAAQAATLVNADFGGLHLKRMGRNPDLQKAAQLILLAPDWTESNWRTVTGMVPGLNDFINKKIGDNPELPGMGKVYRRFWKGVAIRLMATVALANVAIVGLFADKEEREDYFDMLAEQATLKNIPKGKWLSVPIDPLIPEGWKHPEKRRLLSVAGHFKDILKILPTEGDPLKPAMTLAKHKISPVARIVETMATGTDWKGARFTTSGELVKTGKLVVDNQYEKAPSGFQFGGSFPSLLMYNLRSSVPIAGSELLQAIGGETTWISALSRAGGMEVRDVRRTPVAQQQFEKESSKINELDRNLKQARTMKNQKLIFEARRDIKEYDGFNRKKARIGVTKNLIRLQNNKIKSIKAKMQKDIDLTEREEQLLREVNEKKQAIYSKAMTILNR